MAVHLYQYYGQQSIATPSYGNVDQNDFVQTLGFGSPSVSRTDEIVPVAQGGFGCFDTEKGYIEITGYYMDDPLPLCIDNDVLGQWFVDVEVCGGYEPCDGFIIVRQKGELAGCIKIDWTPVEKPDDACCCMSYYHATFSTEEKICLDSNQYPDVSRPFWLFETAPGDTIPGKEVKMFATTFWRGCHQPNQSFVIISVQDAQVLAGSYLSPQSK